MRVAVLCHSFTVLLATVAPAQAEETCTFEPAKLRFEDDFECPQDGQDRREFPNTLKAMPLQRENEIELSVGGEIRQRFEYTQNPQFGEIAQSEPGVWLQRYTLHSDLRIGPQIRVFAQLSSALEFGRRGGPSPVDENALALQNGFIDLALPLSSNAGLTLRTGRQELQLGSGRLVDVREGPNVRRTFDAVSATLGLADWSVQALLARPVDARAGAFDDKPSKRQLLWGMYATARRTQLLPGAIEFYYLGFEDNRGTFVQGTALERRHSVGTRISGAQAGWDWNWEGIYQFGTFGVGKISAWSIATDTGFTFRDKPWQPRVAISANIASGDSDPNNPDLGTMNAIFPRGNYFSQEAVLGPRNFYNLHPFVTVQPAHNWSLTADINLFWRLSKQDGVYSPSGQLFRPPSGSDERFVGSSVSLTSSIALAKDLNLTVIYTHFWPGDFIRATGPSRDIDFVDFTLQVKF